MIPPRLAAEIRRLATTERWPPGRIARQLKVHHSTVRRVLGREGVAEGGDGRRPSMLDGFVPWLREQLARFPTLPASQLYDMARRRGYAGGGDHFRHRLAELGLRPRKAPEAFFELRTLPGEQAQVDWADFGSRQVAGGTRRLFAFVMVLSYSRHLFVRFFFDARLPSFLAGHVEAFAAFNGAARLLLYDNLKSAVLERLDEGIRFHPRLLELADAYGYEPRPVAPGRGNEKGRVERSIRYLRSAFFPLRAHLSLDALNAEARRWCQEVAAYRGWPQDRRRTVEQAFRQEQPLLLPLPAEPFPCHETVVATVRRTPYVAFDANRYSIPHDRIDRTLTVLVGLSTVRIFDREAEIASHCRCWDKGQMVECEAHLDALWKAKRKARLHRGQDRLLRTVPAAQPLLVALAKRQRHLGSAVTALLRLLDEHGRDELTIAITEALSAGSPHPETVRLVLDRRRTQRGQPPPLRVELPDDPKVRDLVVTPLPPRRLRPGGRHVSDLERQARSLKLHGLLAHWQEVQHEPWLARFLGWEEQERARRGLERRLRRARLGAFKPIADFDWAWPKKIDRTQIEDLFGLDWMQSATNVVLVGSNGLGKTLIAKNLAHQAVLSGATVRCLTASELLNTLADQTTSLSLHRKLALFCRPHLLVIDEVGYLSYDSRHADLLFEIVSRRYLQRPILVTTNKAFGEWGEVFPNATSVVTLIDRLVHRCEIVSIEGESYRNKEHKEAARRRAQERAARRKP